MKSAQSGESKVAALIYLLIAILIFYVLFKLIPPYMDFLAIEDEAHQQVRLAKIIAPDMVRRDILELADNREVSILDEDVDIRVSPDGRVYIHLYWEVDVDFGYDYVKTLKFEIEDSNYDAEE